MPRSRPRRCPTTLARPSDTLLLPPAWISRRPYRDSVDRLGEPQLDRMPRRDRQPPRRQLRNGRTHGQPLRLAVPERPAEPDGRRTTTTTLTASPGASGARSETAAADVERDRAAARAEGLRRDQRAAERLHLDARKRDAVRSERRSRPPDHSRRQRQRSTKCCDGDPPDHTTHSHNIGVAAEQAVWCAVQAHHTARSIESAGLDVLVDAKDVVGVEARLHLRRAGRSCPRTSPSPGPALRPS